MRVNRVWDKGQGGSIALFFVGMIPLALAICTIAVRLVYVTVPR